MTLGTSDLGNQGLQEPVTLGSRVVEGIALSEINVSEDATLTISEMENAGKL